MSTKYQGMQLLTLSPHPPSVIWLPLFSCIVPSCPFLFSAHVHFSFLSILIHNPHSERPVLTFTVVILSGHRWRTLGSKFIHSQRRLAFTILCFLSFFVVKVAWTTFIAHSLSRTHTHTHTHTYPHTHIYSRRRSPSPHDKSGCSSYNAYLNRRCGRSSFRDCSCRRLVLSRI
jgi:hypothetical protein